MGFSLTFMIYNGVKSNQETLSFFPVENKEINVVLYVVITSTNHVTLGLDMM